MQGHACKTVSTCADQSSIFYLGIVSPGGTEVSVGEGIAAAMPWFQGGIKQYLLLKSKFMNVSVRICVGFSVIK